MMAKLHSKKYLFDLCEDLQYRPAWILSDWIYSVDFEVWSKLAQPTRIKRIVSKFARDFDWQHVSAFFP